MILDRERVASSLEGRGDKLVIIDVSFPRNVDPEVGDLDGVELHDIDGLRGVARENMLHRNREIHRAERIVAKELELLENRLDEMRVSDLISAIRMKYDIIKEREVRKVLNRLDGSPGERENILEEFATALTSRFLADPTASLKSASREDREEILDLARHLFGLKEGENVS